MTRKADVDAFLAQRTLAVVGVSRTGKGFGNLAVRELRAKGYQVLVVNPAAESVGDQPCWPSLAALPEKPDGVLVVVPPDQAEKVVGEAADAGIGRVWLQQGSQSTAAVALAQDRGLQVVAGECILMFAEPVGWGHRLHRGLWQLLGKLPK